MKQAIYCIVLLFSFSWSLALQAQKLSKEEKKKLKAENKQLKKEVSALMKDPAKYQGMKNQLQDYTSQANEKRKQVASQEVTLAELEDELAKKDPTIQELRASLEDLRKQAEENGGGAFPSIDMPDGKGIVFKVQIGAYLQADFSQYTTQHPNFSMDTEYGGYKRYLIGYFRNYQVAMNFRNFLDRMMGITRVKDRPMVVGYKDGQRIKDLKSFMSTGNLSTENNEMNNPSSSEEETFPTETFEPAPDPEEEEGEFEIAPSE